MFLIAGMVAWGGFPSGAIPAGEPALLDVTGDVVGDVLSSPGSWFAKFDGVDGEANEEDHADWIQILSIDWGMELPDLGSDTERRRGAVDVHDFTITFPYDKAAPKLQEKTFKGEVIPTLEIELVIETETRDTYLRYEMKNVVLTGYHVSGPEAGLVRPLVTVNVDMDEMKTTYSAFDEDGTFMGTVETEFKKEN